MRDFPTLKKASPEEAFAIVQSRFQGIEQTLASLAKISRAEQLSRSAGRAGLIMDGVFARIVYRKYFL
jgi:hypothetical protein